MKDNFDEYFYIGATGAAIGGLILISIYLSLIAASLKTLVEMQQ